MKNSLRNERSFINKKLMNIFIFILTGFFLAQFMLLNILYTKNPQGGWITPLGDIPTFNILIVCLFALLLCIAFLWRLASLNHLTDLDKHQDQEMLLILENT